MKNRNSIGFLIINIILLSFILFPSKANESDNHMIETPESVTADGTALKEEGFYLFEVNGYVVVYLNDKKTPYEYTDILYQELPELLRQEIKNGKYMKTPEELYGFLENYSS